MIEMKIITINNDDSFDLDLLNSIPKGLCDKYVISKLKKYLSGKCDQIIVEYPYHDSDYLSSYYIHFSQKLSLYNKMCCRLHVLRKGEYYGFITLRPTVDRTKFGKTLLDPRIFINEKAHLALHNFKAHVVGNEMSIEAFPWKSQQTDISICAHTATWTVIKYFGNRFKNYADTTIGDVVSKTKNEWGREIPSLGLDPKQVSNILKEYGFSPLMIQKKNVEYGEFIDEIVAYIDSGLPMVGFLYPIKHAVSIVGYSASDYSILDNKELVNEIKDKEIDVVLHSKLIKDIYVMDDNYFPYMKVPFDLPDSDSDVDYGIGQLEYSVVPLYDRMQLAYQDVYSKFKVWMENNEMDWSSPSVVRIYITSSTSLKSKALNSENMSLELKNIILNLVLPKFVWCIDISSYDNYKLGLTDGRIIIDTTAPTLDSEPWILRHDSEMVHFFEMDTVDINNKREYRVLATKINPYNCYENNLKVINGD